MEATQSTMEELRQKEVISVTDGSRFGFVGDLVVDLDSGQVRELVVPGAPRFFGLFGRGEDKIFRWDAVRRFGTDLILVEGEPELRRPQKKGWF